MNCVTSHEKPILKARRNNNTSQHSKRSVLLVPSNKTAVPKKRKYEEASECADLNLKPKPKDVEATKPYSANNRLQSYRKQLAEKQNQIVKVHTVLASPNKKKPQTVSSPNEPSFKKIKIDNRQHPTKNFNKARQSKHSSILLNNQSASTNDISNNSLFDDDYEMEWSTVDEAAILSDVFHIRLVYVLKIITLPFRYKKYDKIGLTQL